MDIRFTCKIDGNLFFCTGEISIQMKDLVVNDALHKALINKWVTANTYAFDHYIGTL